MADGKIPEEFEVGAPVLVCRWRIQGGELPAMNRHMRALGKRMVLGKHLTPQLLGWVKQHVEWTLKDGSYEHPNGVLMLMTDELGRAAMAVGEYEPLADTSLSALVERAKTSELEAGETDVAPETIWVARGGSLVYGAGVGSISSGAASLVLDLAATLGIPVERADFLAEDLEMGAACDEAFLVSDEHGVVPASDAKGPMGERFAQSWEALLAKTARAAK